MIISDRDVYYRYIKEKSNFTSLDNTQSIIKPERKKGTWIDEGTYADGHGAHAYRCSECGEHIIEYDPDPCGADMGLNNG